MAQSEVARITDLIRTDHSWFRDHFSALMTRELAQDRLSRQWKELSDQLEVHAAAEEKLFYPHLLAEDDDSTDETKDAIKDHNQIRDAIKRSADCEVGSDDWWNAVKVAESANHDHMTEEEEGPLPDFEKHAPPEEQQRIGRLFSEFESDHAGGRDIGEHDKDPATYVETHSA